MTPRRYQKLTQPQLLRQLLMFVSYCAYELKCNVRSIPGIMSGLRNGVSPVLRSIRWWIIKDSQARRVQITSAGASNARAMYIRNDQPHYQDEHGGACINETSDVGDGYINGLLLMFALKRICFVQYSSYRRMLNSCLMMSHCDSLQAITLKRWHIKTSRWSNSACCTRKTYGKITAFPSGFPR